MNSIGRTSRFIPQCMRVANMSGELGSGAGKGGGAGGAIREAGGAFGKLEVAREEEYFYKKQQQQLKKLTENKLSQREFHEKQIKEHEEALQRHKDNLAKLDK